MDESTRSLSPATVSRDSVRRPFRSLRWRLQAWHALVLTSVLTVFGLVVYALAWESRLQQIDAELDRSAEVIASRVRRLFPGPPPGLWPQPGRNRMRPENGPPGRNDARNEESADRNDRPPRGPRSHDNSETESVSALAPANVERAPTSPAGLREASLHEPHFRDFALREPPGPRDAGQRDTGRSREPGAGRETPVRDFPSPREGDMGRGFRPFEWVGPVEWPTPSLGLPEDFLELFKGDEDTRLYFVVFARDGQVLQQSPSASDVPFPGVRIGEDRLPVRVVRGRGVLREVVHVSSFENTVLVGRSSVKDRAAHHRSGLLLAVAGLTVLAAGLVGGWWTSSRAIRPIAAMTAAAESISAQRLSQRIDLQETDNELGQLASVLNGTFDRLQAAFERQTRFTADASHELRTPVAVILAHADLALSRPRSPEEYRTTLDTCRSAARRMKSLIDGLLTLARFDSDADGWQFELLDLMPLTQECIDLVKPLATERGIVIESDLTGVIARADRSRVAQVITNLLTNAIRYNREGGSVRVTVKAEPGDGQQPGFAILSVADTGIGIASDELPHIFDRFYQVDKVRSRADGSSGLGLSISQTIVTAHGGTLTARSEPGTGTTMEVRLPQRASPA